MVKVICEKTGVEFEAATRRTKNHPQIMAWLSDASREGWYGKALDVLKKGREQHLTTIEAFLECLQDAHDQHMGTGKYNYHAYRKEHLQSLESAIQTYLATYDPDQPVEPDFQLVSDLALLERRLARYCVRPLLDATNAPLDLQSRLRQEVIDAAIKPLRAAELARRDEAKRQFIAALQQRPVVKEESYSRGAPHAGEYSYFLPEQRILICSYSRLDKAPTDWLQEQDSVFCRFVEPTEAETQTPEYQQCAEWMQSALKRQADEQESQKRDEARREAELKAIRESGREPDLFDDIFAGTSDN